MLVLRRSLRKLFTTTRPPLDQSAAIREQYGTRSELHAIDPTTMSVTGWGVDAFNVNGTLVRGPIILTKKLVFEWKVKGETLEDLTVEDFELFKYMKPRVGLIILGTGRTIKYPKPEFMKQLRMIAPVECLDSPNAGATFNLLSREERVVVAALLPAKSL